ncbi:MAG TPA: substrate-binding domain-containing protein [Actinotalea sp.]
MKRSKVSVLVTAALAGLLAASLATPASADPSPQPKDLVGVGSDTTEFAVGYLADGTRVGGLLKAGFNSAAAGSRLVSFDATGPVARTGAGTVASPYVYAATPTVVLRAGSVAINRPNGSGAGKALLFAPNNNTNVNFARSSSSLNTAEVSAGLFQIPFALDGLQLATATVSNAPAAITPAQMVGIYDGTITNWSQIGGSNGVIVPMLPQSGSGTLSFFTAQLTAANGGTPVTLRSGIVTVQEHDSAPIAADANAVGPFSLARFNTQATGIKLEAGFSAQRAVYNVVRTADVSKASFTAVFGPSGFVCSTAGRTLIQAAGFQQLAAVADGGVCGVPTQAATTNFAVN